MKQPSDHAAMSLVSVRILVTTIPISSDFSHTHPEPTSNRRHVLPEGTSNALRSPGPLPPAGCRRLHFRAQLYLAFRRNKLRLRSKHPRDAFHTLELSFYHPSMYMDYPTPEYPCSETYSRRRYILVERDLQDLVVEDSGH